MKLEVDVLLDAHLLNQFDVTRAWTESDAVQKVRRFSFFRSGVAAKQQDNREQCIQSHACIDSSRAGLV